MPSTLMTNLAKEWQKILDTEPNVDHCYNKVGLDIWKKHGPFKLSWIALNSTVPIDLDDEKFKICSRAHVQRIIGKDDKVPDVYLKRSVYYSGLIDEGFDAAKAEHFCVVSYPHKELI